MVSPTSEPPGGLNSPSSRSSSPDISGERTLGALIGSAWSRGLIAVGLGAALVTGLVLGRLSTGSATLFAARDTAMKESRPGPWGVVETVPISLECPEELLPISGFVNKVTVWRMPGYTLDRFITLLNDLEITGALRDEFRSPQVLHIDATGIRLTPSKRILLDLPARTREALYGQLALSMENHEDLVFLLARTFDERFARNSVSPGNVALIRRLSAPWGRYLIFSDVGHLLSMVPDYKEQVRVIRALTAQQSLLMHIRVGPGSDIDNLTSYWYNDGAKREHWSLFESLSRIPGGATVDLTTLLPSSPAAQLYTFPAPHPGSRRDCHWSALNFFRDQPDDAFGNPTRVADELLANYVEIPTDPRYGDLALFFTPSGALVHSSVYIADNVVFTKNGDTSMHPWMLATIADLHDQYSFSVPPNAALQVKFYRQKRR